VNQLLRRLLTTLVLVLGVTAALLQFTRPEVAGHAIDVTTMEFVKSDAPEPPATGWVARQLPDNWQRSNPGQSGYGWYRARVILPEAPAQSWAAFLPTVSSSYRLFVNGIDVGGGAMTGPLVRTMGKPQVSGIPASVLHAGSNDLLLRLRVAPNLRGGLGPITLGPQDVIEPLYDRDLMIRVTLPRALNMAVVFVGVLVLLLWLHRPSETIYGVFAALALVWSLRNFHYTTTLQVPSALWEAFVLGSLGIVVVLQWIFMRRYTGAPPHRLETVFIVGAVAALPLFALLDPLLVSRLRVPWYVACAAFGVWIILLLLRHLRRPQAQAEAGPWVLLGAMVITLLLGLTDLAVSAQLLPLGPSARMSYGAPLLLCALVYAMAEGYFKTYDEARAATAQLEARVMERTRELERTHERLRALERIATVAAERERLMRDMHDGIGSQLITTLEAVERGPGNAQDVARLLRECMDDLRLTIDSLEPDERSLQIALGNLRYRMEPRLRAAGIDVRWHVDDCAALGSAGDALQVLRIVQEALSNILKHAGATKVRLACQERDQQLLVVIEDDGQGFGASTNGDAPERAQRGVHNMQLRARQLGGMLDIESDEGGTRLTLRLPLAQAGTPAVSAPTAQSPSCTSHPSSAPTTPPSPRS
jgi:signal transduction histidine kinase